MEDPENYNSFPCGWYGVSSTRSTLIEASRAGHMSSCFLKPQKNSTHMTSPGSFSVQFLQHLYLYSGFALVAKALLTARADANAVSQAMGKMGVEMGLVMFGVSNFGTRRFPRIFWLPFFCSYLFWDSQHFGIYPNNLKYG